MVKGLVLAFQRGTTPSSVNVKGDPTELKEKRQYLKTNFKSLQYQDNNDQHFEDE